MQKNSMVNKLIAYMHAFELANRRRLFLLIMILSNHINSIYLIYCCETVHFLIIWGI